MRYATLLFDLDHTLFDSDESERLAYLHTMQACGLEAPESHFDRYVSINRAMWTAVEAGTMAPDEVRHRRFEQFLAEVCVDADPHRMADDFVWGLAHHGELYDGARALLEMLAEQVSLALVTNGLSAVQRTRLERLGIAGFFDAIVISSEVGVTKPRREIFDLTFELLGEPDRDTALMVGDSLTSDIAGGRNAGIATCWYNPNGLEPDGELTHVIGRLADLVAIVLPAT